MFQRNQKILCLKAPIFSALAAKTIKHGEQSRPAERNGEPQELISEQKHKIRVSQVCKDRHE
jgi:hypothetical protein